MPRGPRRPPDPAELARRAERARLRWLAAQRVADGSARALRKGAGLTQADLARRFGVSVMAVSTWESGGARPGEDRLATWLELLDRWEAEEVGDQARIA